MPCVYPQYSEHVCMNHHIASTWVGNLTHLKALFLHLFELPGVLSAVVELHRVLLLHKTAGSCSD